MDDNTQETWLDRSGEQALDKGVDVGPGFRRVIVALALELELNVRGASRPMEGKAAIASSLRRITFLDGHFALALLY